MERHQEIERSLHKRFSRTVWNRFVGAVKQYELLSPGDRVAVCLSGGKDSALLAKCMQQLAKVSEFPFSLEFLAMDPGYCPQNRQLILDNAALLDIPLHLFDTRIFDAVYKIQNNPCYLCARMRRGHLYAQAKSLGCNKIALGHHFDDVIETILMSMLYGSQVRTMMPKLYSANYPGMQLIRPLYLVREADIIRWRDYNGLRFLQCACRFTEENARAIQTSKRAEVKALIAQLKKGNSQVDINIFRSVHNVNLQTVIGYTLDGVQHSFLDDYDEKGARNESGGETVE